MVNLDTLTIKSIDSAFEIRFKGDGNSHANVGREYSCLMIKSSGKTIYTSNKNKYVCDERHVIFIPKGALYTFKSVHYGLCYQINFTTLEDENEIATFELKSSTVKTLIEKCVSDYRSNVSKAKLFSSLYEIFAEIQSSPYKSQSPLDKAIDFINANYQNPSIKADDIANSLNISGVYLRKLFAKELGIPPKKYLQKHRMKKAVDFLVEGMQIKEIVPLVGYTNVYSFSRAFKEIYGKAPQNYIKGF